MRLIPRNRLGTWWRILLASVLVIGFAAGTTAVAGLLQVKNIVDDLKLSKPLTNIDQISLPAPGKPETLLLIGADHRIGEGAGIGNTDTMLLVRINDSSSTINLLSVPRDLEVTDPSEGITKLNAIYSSYGPDALLKTLSHQVFPGLKVNHVIIVSFLGFSRLIDAIGCVYADVDHRYYNNTAQTDYSSIDIQPGYQRLCGWNAASNGALAFVRFRHTDSDLVREARQQDFIRWAKQNYSTSDLLTNESKLLKIFGKNAQTDASLQSEDALIDLANLMINANGSDLKSIPFPASSYPVIDGQDFVASTPSEEHDAFHDFMHPTPKAVAKPTKPSGGGKKKTHKHHALSTSGTTADPGDGKSQAAQLGRLKLPIYYPKLITADSDYCFTITGNCNEYPNPPSAYKDSYPRRYSIKAPTGKRYPAYVLTLEINSALGEYYTIQGTTWRDPPLLRDPTGTLHVHGRTLHEYENGGKLSVVSFDTSKGVYWISNTLTDAIPNSQMLAIAASFTPAG
jgi:LCP family protein required for cell wall assembly